MIRVHAAFALAVATLVVTPAAGAGRRRAPLRGPAAGPDDRARASKAVEGTCQTTVLEELSAGRIGDGGCADDRRRARRAAVRAGFSFGYVASREVDLRAVRMVVGKAVLCRRWPLRRETNSVLRPADVREAGCRLRRATRPVTVAVVDGAGRRIADVMTLRPDADGRIALSYGALDLELRAAGHGTLHDFDRAEVGQGGWAGTVDLARLREFRASWHLQWVRAGRGAPGLFVARHPEHSGAAAAQTLAEQAAAERARALLRRVLAGEVTPQEFLRRYPDSPLRAHAEEALGLTPPERQPASPRPSPR